MTAPSSLRTACLRVYSSSGRPPCSSPSRRRWQRISAPPNDGKSFEHVWRLPTRVLLHIAFCAVSLARLLIARTCPLLYRVTVVNTRHSSYIFPPPPLVCACECGTSLRNNFAVQLKKCGVAVWLLHCCLRWKFTRRRRRQCKSFPLWSCYFFLFLTSPLFQLILSGRLLCALVLYRCVYK